MRLIIPQKYWKKAFIMILSLLVLVFSGRYLIRLGHEISTEVLKNLIQVETEGRYEIDFQELTLSVGKKKISISGLSLMPILSQDQYSGTIYEIGIDSVIVHLESLRSIYLDRTLAIDSVRIIDPRLRLINSTGHADSSNFSLQTGNLYQVISDQLAILRIDKFHVENGNLAHSPSNFSLTGFDFSINGLLMDSIRHKDRLFYSTQIVLEINNQKMLLPDSVHEVGFEKFLLSTADSVLRFRNAFIRPTDSSGVSYYQKNEINVYDIKVPELGLKGVDYIKAYNDNVLSIDEVYISQPNILIDNENTKSKEKKSTDNNLLKLLTGVFDRLQVGAFHLNEANVDIKLNNEESGHRLSSKRTQISMYGMILDTTNAVLDEKYKYFDSARFTLFDYAYNLPDSIHRLKTEQLILNSRDSSIRIKNLSLSPERNPNAAQTLVYLDIPRSELSGVRFKEALIGDVLRLKDFKIEQPHLRVLPAIKRTRSQNNKTNLTPKDLYGIISIRYRDFYSRSFQINNGLIQVEDKGAIDDFSLNLSHIALDRSDELWTDLINEMDLRTGKIQWKQDTVSFSVNQLQIQDKGRTANITGFNMQGNSSDFRFRSQNIRLSGHRPNRLITGDFFTDTLRLVKPVLNWNQPANVYSMADSVHQKNPFQIKLPDQLGYLIVENGAISFEKDSLVSLICGDLNVSMSKDPNQPLDWLSLSDFSAVSRQGLSPKISMGKLSYDRFSRNAVIQSFRLDISDSNWTAVDRIILAGMYQKGLFSDQYLLGSRLFLDGFEGHLNPEALKNYQSNKKNDKPKISFGQVLIDNKKVQIELSKEGQLVWEKGNVSIQEFSLKERELFSDRSFLFGKSGDFSGTLIYQNKDARIELSDFLLDSKSDRFKVDSVSFINQGSMAGVFKQVQLKGFSMDELQLNNAVKIKSFSTQSSEVTVIRQKDQVARQIFQLPFNNLTIDSISSTANNWTLLDKFNEQETRLNELSFEIRQLKMDSLNNTSRWFDYVYHLNMSGRDFEQPLNKDYRIKVDQYAFDKAKNQVRLEGVSLKPELDRYTYSQEQTIQKSWYDVNVSSITVDEIDYESLSKGRYVVQKVDLDQIKAEIYRDKNNPFPEGQYRSMPQKALHDIRFPLWIDTVSMTANIRYAERPIDSELEGVMTFDDINGYLLNIRTEDTLSNQPMILLAEGKLFDQAPFNIRVRFDQTGPMYPFRMQGSVKDFDLVALNQMLGPVAGVNIRSGYGEEIEFNFTANDRVATGDMRFRYDDLKISILNKKTHEAQGLGRGIKTFFANTFVVQKKNPRFFFVKKGQIFYERDTSRAVFNYWGKALISGAVSSIGINKSDRAQKKYQKNLEDELTDD